MNTEFWQRWGAPTLSDTVPIAVNGVPGVSKGLLCLAAGIVKVTQQGGETDTITVAAGWVPFMIPGFITHVWATTTTIPNTDLRVGA